MSKFKKSGKKEMPGISSRFTLRHRVHAAVLLHGDDHNARNREQGHG